MAAGDFNGDGTPDLAVPVSSGQNVSCCWEMRRAIRPEHDGPAQRAPTALVFRGLVQLSLVRPSKTRDLRATS